MAASKFFMQIKTAGTDEWYTFYENAVKIVPFLVRGGYKRILCPFDKDSSNFVKALTDNGFDVTYSHIDTGTDFFDIENLTDYDAVVSNPPFSKRDKIFARLFESGVPFALMMNGNGIFDSKARHELFKNNDFEIIVPKGRMRFFNDEIEHTNSPNFQTVWVCRGMCEKQIEFID